jgi:predicted N-acyltransferase
MKKTFQLAQEGKNPDRLLDAIKHDIRRYIKRERSRALPKGVDFWDFDCRVGATEPESAIAHVAELNGLVDTVASAGGAQVYVEILAKHGHRKPREDKSAN